MNSLLSRYLEKLIQSNRTIDSRGVMQVNRMIAVELDDIYISLNFKLSSQSLYPTMKAMDLAGMFRNWRDNSENSERVFSQPEVIKHDGLFRFDSEIDNVNGLFPGATIKEIVPLDELWNKGSRWVMLGDPGAGKTTLLKYLAFSYARQSLKSADYWIPLTVTLRNFAQEWKNFGWNPNETIMNFLCGPLLEEMGFLKKESHELRDCFEQTLEMGKALLLLDGLDEQRNATTKQETNRAVEALLSRFPNNRCVVTSRIIGYDLAPLHAGFRTATLEPFNDKQIAQFFNKWFYAIERSEDIIDDEATQRRAEKKVENLIEQIKGNEAVRGLAANPLLCTIIGLIYRQGGSTLPNLRAELYKICIDTFIFNWEMSKIRKGIEQVSLDKDETQAALEAIALHLHENSIDNAAPREKLVETVTAFLQDDLGYSPYQAKPRAELLLDLARDVAGLLIERGHDTYGFFHLTFQEYLTARAITRKRRLIDHYLGRYLFSPRWREVIRLAAAHQGMKDEESGTEFINAILRHPHQREEEMQYAFRIAFQCATEARVELKTADDLMKRWVSLSLHRPELWPLLSRTEAFPRYRDETLDPLFRAMDNENNELRERAIKALGQIQATQAVRPLIEALSDGNNDIRWRAAYALGELKAKEAEVRLIEALRDEDEDVRWGAAQALGEIKSTAAIEPLIEALRDNNENVRWSIVSALCEIEAAETVGLLVEALQDENENLRSGAAEALGEIIAVEAVGPLIEALRDVNENVRKGAAEALGEIKAAEAIGPLIEALADGNKDVREGVAEALGEINAVEAVRPLIEALRDKNQNLRSGAAEALGALNIYEAVGPLIEALRDVNEDVRNRAAEALGEIKAVEAVEPLIEALADVNEGVRKIAAEALGKIKADHAVEPLIEALRDANEGVRRGAAEALGEMKAIKAMEPLIEALRDENEGVRIGAAEALGEVKAAEAMGPLIEALRDESKSVRWRVAITLGQNKVTDAVVPLIKLLQDEEEEVRWSAVQALSEIKATEALQSLVQIMLNKNERQNVRSLAVRAIEKIEMGDAL